MIILEEQSSLIFRPDRLRDTELLEINRIGHQRPDFVAALDTARPVGC